MSEMLKNIILSIVALGGVTLFATFFIILNKCKKEIWGCIEFEKEHDKKRNDRHMGNE
ncbi:MAG: hypothetical protein J6C46_08465 [Clostridia bacterium]|nr:hypothetical protein [Clostridia bacterium]